MTKGTVTCLVAAAVALFPGGARAQSAGEVIAGGGAGITYYCIVSRCDTGSTLVGLAAWAPRSFLLLGASGRWHECFDCDRFVMGEATVELRRPGETWHPFVGLGAGVSSDPELMGTGVGVHAAAGTWAWPSSAWGLRIEVRGRRMGGGDAMGEASVAVARRFPPGSRTGPVAGAPTGGGTR